MGALAHAGPPQFGGAPSPISATSKARIGGAGSNPSTDASCRSGHSANTPTLNRSRRRLGLRLMRASLSHSAGIWAAPLTIKPKSSDIRSCRSRHNSPARKADAPNGVQYASSVLVWTMA